MTPRNMISVLGERFDFARPKCFLKTALCLGIGAALAACQSAAPVTNPPLMLKTMTPALPLMQSIAENTGKCWLQSQSFAPYRLAPGLDTGAGRPRILLVPRDKPEERPVLVVEASGDPATLQAFGPLLASPLRTRIEEDLRQWVKGATSCNGGPRSS